jgi:hypothetical protein
MKSKKNKVSHLFYMDNFKPFSKDNTELQQELTIVKTFSDSIRTELGLDKYATADLKHGRINKSRNISLNNQTVIRNLELDQTYKSLDIEDDNSIDKSQMKEKLVEYYRRVLQTLNPELKENKITAVHHFIIQLMQTT